MASASSYGRNLLSDYGNLRAVPAYLSAAFLVASLYQFGGLAGIEVPWISYTLTTEHSIVLSLGAFAVAFMSSETKSFEAYEGWEQVGIALGPALILGNEYVTEVHDLLIGLGDPLGMQLAFVGTVISWGIAVR